MPTGDGGMITTDDDDIAAKIRKMTWFGIQSTYDRVKHNISEHRHKSIYKWEYDIDVLGYKYYMIDLTAALGLSQMSRLQDTMKRRQFIQEKYNQGFLKYQRNTNTSYSHSVQHYIIQLILINVTN